MPLLLSGHAITLCGSVTWMTQVSFACVSSAIASDFKVVFESLMGVEGHQNAPLWLPHQWALDNNIVPLREREKGRIGVHGSVPAVTLNWAVSADGFQRGRWEIEPRENYTVGLPSPACGCMYPVSRQRLGLGGCRRHGRRIFCFIFYHFHILAQELDKVLLLSVKSKLASACCHSVILPPSACIGS